MQFLDITGTLTLWENVKQYIDTLYDSKVDKIDGKQLSTNDFTDTLKVKLESLKNSTITGVKGSAESSYRTGDVNITKANIGLNNVDNTSDINKPVSTAQKTAIDAVSAKIPTKTSLLTNDSEFVKTSTLNSYIHFENRGSYVAALFISNSSMALVAGLKYIEWWQSQGGWFNFNIGKLECTSVKVRDGLNTQFLKANGSLDSNTYATIIGNPVNLNNVDGFGFAYQSTNDNASTALGYPIQEAGALIYCPAAYNKSNLIYGTFNSNRWFARGGGNTSKTNWKEFAFKSDIPTNYMNFNLHDSYVRAPFSNLDIAKKAAETYIEFWHSGAGWYNFKAGKYIVDGGTSSLFLKGNGTLDSTLYLPLSGGTMTGTLRVNTITSADNNGLLSYHPTGWTGVTNTQWGVGAINCQGVIRSDKTNLIHYKGDTAYTIWDANNDGAGSGLDADLLDGMQGSWFFHRHTIDATKLAEDTYYPVTVHLKTWETARFEICVALNSGTKPSWSTHASGFSTHKVWTSSATGYGTANNLRLVFESSYRWTDSDPVCGVGQMVNSSNEYFYVRGGGKYFLITNHDLSPVLHTAAYTENSETISPTKTKPSNFVRGDGIRASLLYTSRSIWGQTFNGTSNVSGDMTDVGSISMSKSINVSTNTGGVDQGLIITGTKYKLGFMIGGGDINRGIYDYTNNHWMLYRAASNDIYIPNGNVGIGTTSPTYKLLVAGTMSAEQIRVNSTGLVSNLNADMLDGCHANEFTKGLSVEYTAKDATGRRWIRIAQSSTYNAYGIFTIGHTWTHNSNNDVTFIVSNGYRNNTAYSITQIGGPHNIVFMGARIVHPTSTDAAYYVEVDYNESTSGHNDIYVQMVAGRKYTLLTTATTGSIPSGYAAYTLTFSTNGIAANNILTNTITVSSTDRVANLNADMLDGYHADYFVKQISSLQDQIAELQAAVNKLNSGSSGTTNLETVTPSSIKWNSDTEGAYGTTITMVSAGTAKPTVTTVNTGTQVVEYTGSIAVSAVTAVSGKDKTWTCKVTALNWELSAKYPGKYEIVADIQVTMANTSRYVSVWGLHD